MNKKNGHTAMASLILALVSVVQIQAQVLSQSVDETTIIPGNSISCNVDEIHTGNSYFRSFNLATQGVSGDYSIGRICLGIELCIENADGSGKDNDGMVPVQVNFYWTTALSSIVHDGVNGPSGMDASVDAMIPGDGSADLTVFEIPIAGITVPASATDLVVEIFTPGSDTVNPVANGDSLFVGSNAAGQTGSTFLAATGCGLNAPTPTEDIGSPNMNMVLLVKEAIQASGLQHTVVGNATLDTDDMGRLIVGNIGSSGKDGVRVNLGEAEGYSIQFDPSDSPADGSYLEFSTYGELDGFPESEISIVRIEPMDGEFGVSLDVSNIGIEALRVEARLDGRVVSSQTFSPAPPPGDIIARVTPSGCQVEFCSAVLVKFIRWIFDLVAPITVGDCPPVMADQLVFISLEQKSIVGPLSSNELRAANIPQITICDEAIGMFGQFHSAIGEASFNANQPACTLTVDNIGSGLSDGFSTQFSGAQSANYCWQDLNAAGPYGAGAELAVSAVGTLSGIPDTELGTLRFIEMSGGEKAIEADYPSSNSYIVEVYNSGSLVVSIQNHTGTIATVPAWPSGCGKADEWEPWDLQCFVGCWEGPKDITIVGNGTFFGDEIRVLAEGSQPVDSISQLGILTNLIPQIILTDVDAQTPFLLLGDVNLDGLVNLLDVAPFVDLLTNGGFQPEADINGDLVVNLLDVAPFVALLTGGP